MSGDFIEKSNGMVHPSQTWVSPYYESSLQYLQILLPSPPMERKFQLEWVMRLFLRYIFKYNQQSVDVFIVFVVEVIVVGVSTFHKDDQVTLIYLPEIKDKITRKIMKIPKFLNKSSYAEGLFNFPSYD